LVGGRMGCAQKCRVTGSEARFIEFEDERKALG
jgi:hypothetical protein